MLLKSRHCEICKTLGNNGFCYMFQESWANLSSTDEVAGEGELWKVSHGETNSVCGAFSIFIKWAKQSRFVIFI